MLDILRRHASSWVIKVVLGAIVVSFIFFFGYSSMRSQKSSAQDEVATVNGRPISVAEYKFILDNNYERLRSQFKGNEVPDFVEKMARAQSLRQLIGRELGLELADKAGVVVPDVELIKAIKQTPYALNDGEFDPIFYRHKFLPYFKQRFNLDYETFLKDDIRLGTLEGFFKEVDKGIPTTTGEDSKEMDSRWTFESVTLDPAKVVEDGKANSPDEVRQVAALLISSKPGKWKGLVTPFDGKVTKVGPITIRERRRLIGGQGTFDDMSEIFSLTKGKPVLSKPIESGGKIYVIRLVDMKEGKPGDSFWPARDFFNLWMAKLSEKAKIVNYLPSDQ